jgi:glycosyltransferase involved in cell wall biosynthesis
MSEDMSEKKQDGVLQGPRIAIDLRYLTEGASGGITPLVVQTLSQVFPTAPRDQFYLLGTIFNQDLFADDLSNVRKFSLPLSSYWSDADALLTQHGIDVLFRSYPIADSLKYPLRKQIVLVPDLQHEKFPQFFTVTELAERRRNFSRLIRGSGAVATISEHARSMIGMHHRTQSDDIFLMPPASQFDSSLTNEAPPEFEARLRSLQPYFFFPANIWPHKNHAALLEAFKIFRSTSAAHAKYSLVLSGHPDGWEALAARHDTTAVTHVGFVSRNKLAFLYRNATALVFLSLFEGFGMPVLEAFGFGCPVLCGNATSLPEVAGEAALLVDPQNCEVIVGSMAAIADDDALRASLIAKGRQRFKAYSWDRSAAALLGAFQRVHERNSPTPIVVREVSPLVSIVTPSYNQGRFIGRTIESVLGQSYPRIEYRIIDGGSTDATLDVLKSHGGKLDWISEPDRGQAHAINKGFERSRGEIRAYLNCDDALNPDAVEQAVDHFARNPNVDMLYGDAHYINTKDEITGVYATAEYSFEQLMDYNCVCQPAAFWTTKIADKIGPFDERLNYVMHYDYWLRIDRAGGLIRYVPVFLAYFRLYPETKTLSARRKIHAEIFAVCERHGGYVGRSHVRSYWQHRFHEQPTPFLKLVGAVPEAEKAFVEYTALRLGNPKLTPIQAIREVARKAVRRIAQPSRLRVNGKDVTLSRSRSVRGFWHDGWLTPVSRFGSVAVKSERALRLGGKAAVDCRLEVTSGRGVLLTETLKGGVETTLEFAGPGDEITLTFDAFVHDDAGRKVAFYITQTNLFSEQEL